MPLDLQTGEAAAAAPAVVVPEVAEPAPIGSFAHARRHLWATLKYLTETEVHTYAFSVAANAILSFFPAIVLLLTLTRRVFHSETMYSVVLQMMRDYLPSNQDFVIRNMQALEAKHNVQIFSVVMLVVSSTGIFLPLEVALNKVWGLRKNRSYIGNQTISLVLAVACGVLAVASIGLAAANQAVVARIIGDQNILFRTVAYTSMKVFAMLASIGIFFLIFWVLPNGKVPARSVMPAAVITGVVFELAKYLYIAALPWLDFHEVYGPFSVSVTLMFWAFLAGLLLLGGAHLSAAEHVEAHVEARQN